MSDGLGGFWPGERLPNGDQVTGLEPELDARIEAATPRIALMCQELAIAELTAVAIEHRDGLARRRAYRQLLVEGFPENAAAARDPVKV